MISITEYLMQALNICSTQLNEYLLGKNRTAMANEYSIDALDEMFKEQVATEYRTSDPYGNIIRTLKKIQEKEEGIVELVDFLSRLPENGFRLTEGLKDRNTFYYSKTFNTEVIVNDDTKLMYNEYSYLDKVHSYDVKLINYKKLEIMWLRLSYDMTFKLERLHCINFDEFCNHVKHTQIMSMHAHDYMELELEGSIDKDSISDILIKLKETL